MNFKKTSSMILSLMIFVSVIALSSSASVLSAKELAFKHISEKFGVPTECLSILKEGEATFPLIGQKLWAAKILDVQTTKIYGVYVDANGKVVDIETLKTLEKEQHTKTYGKLEETLFNRLQVVEPHELIDVWIWLASENRLAKPRTFTEDEYRESLSSQEKAYSAKQNALVNLITANGFWVTYKSRYAPLIFAKVSKSLIIEMQSRPDIDTIYLSGEGEAELDSIVPTVRANAVWNAGITGAGTTVADVESGGRIAFANPNLAFGTHYWPADPSLSAHATAIAGIIESTHATFRGIAFGAPAILNGNARNWTDAELVAATEWAITNGARVVNYSWRDGDWSSLQLGPLDRYVDHVVWDDYVTMVKSAGNEGATSGNITSPGLGYNIITIGSIDDIDNERWSDDVISAFSSWRDPISTHNDREKPEVVAVGQRVTSTTTAAPWVGNVGQGTSYAAPNVVGGAALLMQAQPWLQWWPETVRATLMASAVHNIEGDSRLSEFDGAGAVDLWSAYQTVNLGRIDGWTLYAEDFPRTVTFSATKGQRIRVAIAWDSHPGTGHPPTTDPLESDLDLMITGPDGNAVTSSLSFDNSYEIVDFLALQDGTYSARISAYRFDGTYEFVGFAYCVSPVWTREWYEVNFDGATYVFNNYLGTTTVDNFYFADDWGSGTVAYGRGDSIGFRSFAHIRTSSTTSFNIGITSDDGVRFWVGDQLLLDRWILQAPTNYGLTFTLGLIQTHNLRLDWFEWTGQAVIRLRSNLPPSMPATPSGSTSVYSTFLYTYFTSATDPDGDNVRYEFEFSGPIPTVSFMTGWYASGQTASLTVMWELTDPPGTYYIRTRAQDVYDSWSPWSPSLTVTVSPLFGLREHGVYRPTYNPNIQFLKPSSGVLRIDSYQAGTASMGYGWAFVVVPREWLNGKYIRFRWSGSFSYSGARMIAGAYIYDGEYSRANDSDFPDGADIPTKGAGRLQTLAEKNVGGSWGPETIDVQASVSAGTQPTCTILFRMNDAWIGQTVYLDIDWFEINSGSGGVGRLAYEGFSATAVMERIGTYGDYGYIGP